MSSRRIGALIVVASLLFAGVVMVMPTAQAGRALPPRPPDVTITGPGGLSGFGTSVAADVGYTVVGAYGWDNVSATAAGEVFVYAPGNVNYTLRSPNEVQAGHFGQSVAVRSISGSSSVRVVVGAPGEDVDSMEKAGRVYIYTFIGSAMQSTVVQLTRPGGSIANAYFGNAVAVSDLFILVGAAYENASGVEYAGRAYAFGYTGGYTWELYRTLDSPNPAANGAFGYSVALPSNGAHFFIGAPYENVTVGDITYESAGNVYRFSYTEPAASIASPAPVFDGEFGYSIAATDTNLIVGAPWNTYTAGRRTYSGMAYIYNWVVVGSGPIANLTMVAKKPQNVDFGMSVAADGTYVLVGARNEDTTRRTTDSGAVYVFAMNGTLSEKLTSPNPITYGKFGYSVALDSERAVIGEPGRETVYIYNPPT